jgi:hypothetical protein
LQLTANYDAVADALLTTANVMTASGTVGDLTYSLNMTNVGTSTADLVMTASGDFTGVTDITVDLSTGITAFAIMPGQSYSLSASEIASLAAGNSVTINLVGLSPSTKYDVTINSNATTDINNTTAFTTLSDASDINFTGVTAIDNQDQTVDLA